MMRNGSKQLDLISTAQTGNAEAINQLLIVCQADVRRYAHKNCHASDVDDAVQESLLIISRKIRGLKAIAAFSSWIFTVVKRECGRLHRAMFHHDQLDEDETEQLLAKRTEESLRLDLAAALESLPSHYLEVLILRDFEELTITEIAERLGDQSSAVKSRLHRARLLVREYLLSS